jgi:hypothetical protein
MKIMIRRRFLEEVFLTCGNQIQCQRTHFVRQTKFIKMPVWLVLPFAVYARLKPTELSAAKILAAAVQ